MERIPEIKKLIGLLGHITQQAHWIKLIQTVMNHHRNRSSFDASNLAQLRTTLALSEDVFDSLYTGMFCLLTQVVRNHTRKLPGDLSAQVMEELAPLGLPEKNAAIFRSAFTN
jgi:hypothetical protein